MASLNKGKAGGRLDRVRKATGSSAKSGKLAGLISFGQSQQINALQGKSNLSDSKIHALEDSLQKQKEALSNVVALATKRQEDAMFRLDAFESQTGDVEKRQKELAQALDDNFSAMSRDFERLRNTLEDHRYTWDAEGATNRKAIENMKLDSEEQHQASRMNIQQVQVQCQDMQDTLQALKADIADARLHGGKLHTTKLPKSLQTDQDLTEATCPAAGIPTPGEATNAPDYIKRPPKAIRRFLRQFDRHQDAYDNQKPMNEEDFLWGFMGNCTPWWPNSCKKRLLSAALNT
ncbi:hypothetical protein PG994_010794 [Apiospora phragmitis]|uniref:Uncharacterized protein n=1 Tax=Apiospora phragmitis TaxID=2905665 RepID=A0ABR1TQY4_9PEZI